VMIARRMKIAVNTALVAGLMRLKRLNPS
jgi:hypothetical protein